MFSINNKYTAAKRDALPPLVRAQQLQTMKAKAERKKARRAARDAKAKEGDHLNEDAIVSASYKRTAFGASIYGDA
jgi:hypothetical protein